MKKQVSSITVVTCQKCVHARQNKKVKTKEEQNRRQTQNKTTEGLESLWGRDRLIWLQLPNVGLLFPLVSNRWFLEQSIIDLSTRLSLSLNPAGHLTLLLRSWFDSFCTFFSKSHSARFHEQKQRNFNLKIDTR